MKLRTIISLALPLWLAATLQAQIRAPKVGFVRYSDGTVRATYGLEANFIVGSQTPIAADAVSFSDLGGLISRGGRIRLVGRDASVIAEYDSTETAPVLNVDGDLTTAIAWLPSRHALLHWNGKSFVLTSLTSAISENVNSLRVQSPNSAKLLVTAGDRSVLEATVSLDTGDLVAMNPLPGVHAPAFLQHSFVVFHDHEGLEIESSDGVIRTISLSASDLTIERMSSDWLHLSSAATKQDWALHLSSAALNLSQLPAPREGGK